MSYDVQVWSVESVSLPGMLPDPKRWQEQGNSWVATGKTWQVVVGQSDRVSPEDVPSEVAPSLPGIAYRTEVNLEPVGAPKTAHSLLRRTARSLSKLAHGVAYDPQDGSVTAGTGVKRFPGAARSEVFSILELSWWFLGGPLFESDGISRFIGLLERHLPEALPRRYGLYEPPQHAYDDEGRSHFERFLAEHLDDIVVWYSRRPVAGVSISARPAASIDRRGFRASDLSIGVEAATLTLPGWEAGLRRSWREISCFLQPFYGDVRILHGYHRAGSTYAVTRDTELHPTRGPWWNGVPKRLGLAVVLGREYQALWPAFASRAEKECKLWFASAPRWKEESDLGAIVGDPPRSIVQKDSLWDVFPGESTRYPDSWPLPGPYPDE